MLAYEDKRAAAQDAAAAGSGGWEGGGGQAGDEPAEEEEEEEDDEAQELSPAKGNVAFGSAYDGWAFRIGQFAELYAGGLRGSGST